MTTRIKLRERANRNKKILRLSKQLLITLIIFLFIGLIIDSPNRPNIIDISNTNYECQLKGCDYSFTVTNLSDSLVNGYARITIFKSFNFAAVNSDEILSTERLEFVLKANEDKIIKGFYVTRIEADKLTIGIGVADN